MWGVGNMEIDTVTREFKVVINLKAANELLRDSHIHVAAAGSNGPVIVPFGPEGNYKRVAGKNLHAVFTGVFPEEHLEALLTNGCYLNFHTNTWPGGAARGQLIANDVSLWADLAGSNEVPSRPSEAWGTAAITFNPGTRIISTIIWIENFANTLADSHIHVAPAGSNGPVRVGFGGAAAYVQNGTSYYGEFLNRVWPDTEPVMKVLNEGTYVNVHSNVWPGGEIRGQIVGN
jgi:hypothetical protein